MPAKGGNASLPDADVKAAVDYMVGAAKSGNLGCAGVRRKRGLPAPFSISRWSPLSAARSNRLARFRIEIDLAAFNVAQRGELRQVIRGHVAGDVPAVEA